MGQINTFSTPIHYHKNVFEKIQNQADQLFNQLTQDIKQSSTHSAPVGDYEALPVPIKEVLRPYIMKYYNQWMDGDRDNPLSSEVLNNTLHDVYCPHAEIKFDLKYWFTVLHKDQFINPHTHHVFKSLFTCVLYLTPVRKELGGELIVTNPNLAMASFPYGRCDYLVFRPQVYDFILLPSFVQHQVMSYKGEEPRISMVVEFIYSREVKSD